MPKTPRLPKFALAGSSSGPTAGRTNSSLHHRDNSSLRSTGDASALQIGNENSTAMSATGPTVVLQPPTLPSFDFEQDPQDLSMDIPDNDSAFGGESYLGDDTQTLASFITDYRYENGRRYHAYQDGAYWGPNDEHASEQQDLAHHMYLLTLDNQLYLAPIENPQRVLDIGTGTGIWAIDMADEHPQAHIIGMDLSPIQPDFIPPNCSFEIDDVTLAWTYPPDHFDFIHVREMFGSIPDWDAFFEQAFTHSKPGGYVEVVEHSVQPRSDDDTVGPDHFFTRWGDTVLECGRRFGKGFSIWKEAKDRMIQAGFEDVHEVYYRWPMNGWSRDVKEKELGMWNQLRLHDGIEGMMMRLLTTALGWTFERSQAFLGEMRKALVDYDTHAFLDGTVVYGRKPLPAE